MMPSGLLHLKNPKIKIKKKKVKSSASTSPSDSSKEDDKNPRSLITIMMKSPMK
jgi:hypothetical protein